jgi:hypothetical protein
MRLPVPSPKVREIARRSETVIAKSLIVVGAGWFLFEFAAQFVYLRPEFRELQPELGYIWATPMKGRYAYLSHTESLLEIYMPTAFGLFFAGGFWLDQIRKARERK